MGSSFSKQPPEGHDLSHSFAFFVKFAKKWQRSTTRLLPFGCINQTAKRPQRRESEPFACGDWSRMRPTAGQPLTELGQAVGVECEKVSSPFGRNSLHGRGSERGSRSCNDEQFRFRSCCPLALWGNAYLTEVRANGMGLLGCCCCSPLEEHQNRQQNCT